MITRVNSRGEFSDFHKFTLYMFFLYFLELPIPIMAIIMKNFENNIKGESMKFREWDILMRDIFGYPQLGST